MLNQYRRRYLARLRTLLKEFYELANEGSTAHTGAKNKLDGFIDAGKATFIVNNADLRKLIDDVHYDVFKMTREERKEQGGDSELVVDWAAYEEPIVLRNGVPQFTFFDVILNVTNRELKKLSSTLHIKVLAN